VNRGILSDIIVISHLKEALIPVLKERNNKKAMEVPSIVLK
jgi:hypothetical protein